MFRGTVLVGGKDVRSRKAGPVKGEGPASVDGKALRSVSGDARHRTGLRRVDDDLACHGCAGMSALIWIARETAGCQGILWYAVENYLRSYGIRFVGKQLRGVAVGVVTVLMPVSVVGAVWPPSCRQSHG